MPVSEATYKQVALEDPDGKWALICGCLQQQDRMTAAHNDISRVLGFRLQAQLPLTDFRVCVDNGRVRRPSGTFFIPDLMIVPTGAVEAFKREHPTELEAYDQPLPLVVEVWSPSTSAYDRETKAPDWRARRCRDLALPSARPHPHRLGAPAGRELYRASIPGWPCSIGTPSRCCR